MMLADMGLLLMAFFALMVAQSGPQSDTQASLPVEKPLIRDVPKDAVSLLASLREQRVAFEPLDLTMPFDPPVRGQNGMGADPVEDLRRSLAESLSSRVMFVERSGDSVVVSLGSIGNFAAGSADLDASAVRSIETIAALIGGLQSEIAVEGHADAAPMSGQRYKDTWELAGARAVAVLRELKRGPGTSASSMRAVSFGDARAALGSDDPQQRERNRRVEIRIRPI